MNESISYIPLGGIGDVTRNMHLYEYKDQILIVDCGLGFADETMLGVDLLLPDISYLTQTKKRIAGMLLTHGHEDHIGALPFVLTSLISSNGGMQFPIYGSPFTALLANEKLKEFGLKPLIQTVLFNNNYVALGEFGAYFIHVTHSVPDTAHIFIKTPAGNFYHGSDFKFEETPPDGKQSDLNLISKLCSGGVTALMSDCLGSERQGITPSEGKILDSFTEEAMECNGKFIVTTYSSNIARINQIISVSEKVNRKVCFIGRSFVKTKEVAKKLDYLRLKDGAEVPLDQIKNYQDNQLTLIVAGSQGQEESAMSRIANGEHREVALKEDDTVIFSSDPIPGNEVLVYGLIDTIAKTGARVLYSPLSKNFHVSGHGSQDELMQLVSLVKPKKFVPIGGAFRHMTIYRDLVGKLGYKKSDIFLVEDGQEVVFKKDNAYVGRMIPIKNVYVDEISEDVVESFVLRDRQKLSEGGIVTLVLEIDSATGQLVVAPDIIIRGFTVDSIKKLSSKLFEDLQKVLRQKKGRVVNWVYIRKLVGEIAERRIFKELHRRPLVLPVVIEI